MTTLHRVLASAVVIRGLPCGEDHPPSVTIAGRPAVGADSEDIVIAVDGPDGGAEFAMGREAARDFLEAALSRL